MSIREVARTLPKWAVPLAVIIALAIAAIVFRAELFAWFTGEAPQTKAEGAVASAGPFEVHASLRPDPPRERGNTLSLHITEAGQAVEGADVSVVYSMPAMGAMPAMRGEADVAAKDGGKYIATFDLPMGGSWTLEVTVGHGGHSATANYGLTIGARGLTVGSGSVAAAGDGPRAPALEPQQLVPPVFERVAATFVVYESVRAQLARDSLVGVATYAEQIAADLHAALGSVGEGGPHLHTCLTDAAQAAHALAAAQEIEEARDAFASLSMYLVALGSADPRLTEGWHIFECPMARGFGKWFQKSNELANPYMGQKMLKCGNATTWSVPALERAQAPAADNGEIAYYTCPMHPSVRQQTPGQCPICSMDLTPVTRTEVESGTILVDAERRQRIGVRTEVVKARELSTTVRTVGEVTYDESRLFDVNLRVSGWVQDLRVTNTGSPVKKGQRLFTLYSPELYASQREFLSVAGTSAPQSVGKLAEVSRTRLHLLGMTDAQIRELARRGTAQENVPILSPASGYVIEKNVVEGAQVEAGTQAYRIADLSKIWIDANVYESDLRHVKPKQAVSIELPFVPGRTYEGEVDYVYPKLEGATRTGQVRIVVKNPDLELKPNMYADVVFEVDLGERLAIPESAVIYTGPRRLVFVDLGEGRLRPQVVKLGIHADGWFEVVEGLNAGDTIVTSANFLIAAESRLRSAAQYWQGGANDDSR